MNYDLEMTKIISSLSNKPKLLLHVCCAPCSSACIERLLNHFDITLYYFNPNTFPEEEYLLRAKQFSKLTNLPLVVENYNHKEFLDLIKGHEQDKEGETRCELCIRNRLEKSFNFAEENQFDYITTTLTVSPHKNSKYINEIGLLLEQNHSVKYLPSDFKKNDGFKRSITLSNEHNLYRQDYCGCEFSMRK